MFAVLQDKELIDEFGDEVTIKTDFNVRLPKKDDYAALTELRQAIFNVVKKQHLFIATRSKLINRMMSGSTLQKKSVNIAGELNIVKYKRLV
jgi:hypothetical protein